MIENVKVKKLVKHVDERGFLMEILRDDDFLLTKFGQLNISSNYPEVIKAFHYHKIQDELWFFVCGNAQVVLFDRRENSPTPGETNTFYMGDNNSILLYIPVGVVHGFQVLGSTAATIITVSTKSFNPDDPDIYRIPWNDPEIGFNWES